MVVRAGDPAGLDALLRAVRERPAAPVLLAGGTVRGLGSRSDGVRADVVVEGATVAAVGGRRADLRDAVVVDCTGTTLVPAAGTGPRGPHDGGGAAERLGTLEPGSPATFAVLADPAAHGPLESVVWYPDRAAAMVVDGVVTSWAGGAVARGGEVGEVGSREVGGRSVDGARLGTWLDEQADVAQHLTPDGRYVERRGRRERAYQGSFWIDGDGIVYRDDLGFWAYGRFDADVLRHVHFRFRRV